MNCQCHAIQLTTRSLNTCFHSPSFPLASFCFLCRRLLLSLILSHWSCCCRSVLAHFMHHFHVTSSSPPDNAISVTMHLGCACLELEIVLCEGDLYTRRPNCQLGISTWMSQSHLKFNVSKTDVFISPNPLNYFFPNFNKWQLYPAMSEIWYILCHVRNRAFMLDASFSIILSSNYVHFNSAIYFLNSFTPI